MFAAADCNSGIRPNFSSTNIQDDVYVAGDCSPLIPEMLPDMHGRIFCACSLFLHMCVPDAQSRIANPSSNESFTATARHFMSFPCGPTSLSVTFVTVLSGLVGGWEAGMSSGGGGAFAF